MAAVLGPCWQGGAPRSPPYARGQGLCRAVASFWDALAGLCRVPTLSVAAWAQSEPAEGGCGDPACRCSGLPGTSRKVGAGAQRTPALQEWLMCCRQEAVAGDFLEGAEVVKCPPGIPVPESGPGSLSPGQGLIPAGIPLLQVPWAGTHLRPAMWPSWVQSAGQAARPLPGLAESDSRYTLCCYWAVPSALGASFTPTQP